MEPVPAPDENDTPRRRRRRSSGQDRHPHGRAWVVALWCVLRLGDLPLVWTAFRALDPAPTMRVPVLVSIMWTTAIFVALWAKQIWARYVLALFLSYFVFSWGFSLSSLIVSVARGEALLSPDRFVILLTATLLYLGVALTVMRSKNIKYLTDPAAGWKEREF